MPGLLFKRKQTQRLKELRERQLSWPPKKKKDDLPSKKEKFLDETNWRPVVQKEPLHPVGESGPGPSVENDALVRKKIIKKRKK